MVYRHLLSLFAVILPLMLVSCASPVAPTGGPPDRTPPVIERSEPVDGTVNFDGREIRIGFSKFLNRSSFVDALSIEPDLAIGYEVSWRRKTAIVEFDEDLPENTTLILTLGTELQDSRSNNISAPYQIALSTGDEIDDGIVTARIRSAADGTADTGYRIFLYRAPVDLSARANYIAESDTSGQVVFSHLAADTYQAIWVDDTNRDRIWDWSRERAQPFYDSTFTIEKGGEIDLGTIYADRPDTVRPRLQGVGLLTEERLRLRFDEDVYWDDTSVITLRDSLDEVFTEALPLYVPPEESRAVIAQALQPLPEDQVFSIELEGFHDASGLEAGVHTEPFFGSAQPDSVRLQIIGDNAEPGLFTDEPFLIGYNKFIDDDRVVDSLKVVEGDRLIEEWTELEVDRHHLRIYPDGQWESGITYQFLVWNPGTEQLRPFEPVIWQRNQLGTLEITLDDWGVPVGDPEERDEMREEDSETPEEGADTMREEDSETPEERDAVLEERSMLTEIETLLAETDTLDSPPPTTYLRLYDEYGKVEIDTTFTDSTLVIDQLPPLQYTAMIYRDSNGDGEWNSGTIFPFQAPEPYFVRRDIPVREGFTSELNVSFEQSGGR